MSSTIMMGYRCLKVNSLISRLIPGPDQLLQGFGSSRGGAGLKLHDFRGALAQSFPLRSVFQQLQDYIAQVGCDVAHAKTVHGFNRVCGLEDGNDIAEVLHMRPYQDGHAKIRRLKNVMPPARDQATAHKCNSGQRVKSGELPNAIQQQHPSPPRGWGTTPRTPPASQA